MPLSLITTQSKTALTEVAHSLLSDAVTSGNDAIWILPDHRSARHEGALMAAGAPVGVKAMLFSRFLAELWLLYGDGRQIVERETRELLLQTALEGMSSSLGPLSRSDTLRSALAQVLAAGDIDDKARPGGAYGAVTSVFADYRTLLRDSSLIEEYDAARALALPEELKEATVVVSGFSELTGLQLTILERLAAATQVHVLVQYVEEAPAAEAIGRMISDVESLGAQAKTLDARPADSILAPLAFGLLRPGVFDLPDGSVRFLEVETYEMEYVAIARAVKDRIDSCVRPEQIAVSGWAITKTAARIAEELGALGITAEVDVAVPLARTHFGRAFAAMLNAALGGDRVAASAVLSSSFMPIDRTEADALDARWRGRPPSDFQAIIDDVNRVSGASAALFRDARAALELPVGEYWADALEEIASRMFAVGVQARPLNRIRDDGAAHAAVVSAINAAATLGGVTDKARFLRALGEQRVATGAAVRGEGVLITEVRQLRNRSFDTVVLAGLDADSTDPAVELGLSARIARAYGARERTNPQLRQFGELFLALLAVESQAVFTRTAHDLGNEPERASVVYNELLARTGVTEDEIERVELEMTDFGSGSARGRRGFLDKPESIGVIGAERAHSVTALEAYAGCPYKWFISRALSPRAIDEDSDSLLHGSIAHEALRMIHSRAMSELPEGRVTGGNLSTVRGWVRDAVSAAYESVSSVPADAQGRQWSDAIARRIEAMLAWDAGFAEELKPAHLEWELADEQLGSVTVKGKVDRIDEAPGYIVITDYKSGKAPARNAILEGRRIQPLLYGLIASQKLGKPLAATVFRRIDDERAKGIEIKDALSSPMTSEKIAGPAERMAEDLKWAESVAEEAVAGIRAGAIHTTPSKAACEYCGAMEFCEVAVR